MFVLLIIIYISFISLGLPDSLLGSAWSAIHTDLSVPISGAGIISMIISAGTIVSSLFSTRLIKRFGTGMITAVSVAMTAFALYGFGISKSYLMLCLFSIPLGLGAGSVDSALNNFVALHYKARHMNWLHCFWGIGTTIGPMIMSFWLARENNWHKGYVSIAIFQTVLSVILFLTLPLWLKANKNNSDGKTDTEEDEVTVIPLKDVPKIPLAKAVLLSFFCYCAIETTVGLWGGTYAVEKFGVSHETSALWSSMFYFGITAGRFISGFVSMKFGNKSLIRFGQVGIILGALIMLLPSGSLKLPVALFVTGLGCAPIYPSVIHETPVTFGKSLSQAMIGVQMACAYMGTMLMPSVLGFLAEHVTIGIFPFYILIIVAVMVVCTEWVNRKKSEKENRIAVAD